MKTFLLTIFSVFISTIAFGQLALEFSHSRGVYDVGFQLTVTSNDPDAQIMYTIDGQTPGPTVGVPYNQSIQINATTPFRAIAISNTDTSIVYTHTYIFAADVITQSVLNSAVVNHFGATEMEEALLTVPLVSIVNDYDVATISETEKETSAELIFPDGTEGFQIQSGFKKVGNASLGFIKKNIRLLFKEEWGPTKLEYDVYGVPYNDYQEHPLKEEFPAVKKFDHIQLRGSSGERFGHPFHEHFTYLREAWGYDTQRELGDIAIHTRVVHVLYNGIYYGIADLIEYPRAYFWESYDVGDKTEWDTRNGTKIKDGDSISWSQMYSLRNDYPAIHNYLDVDNFINYMMLNYYASNTDWGHKFRAARHRSDSSGFKFLMWDLDHMIKSVTANSMNKNDYNAVTGLFNALANDADFITRFSDRAYCECYHDGVLTSTRSIDRFNERRQQIEKAIKMEVARWEEVVDYNTLVSNQDYLTTTYFPQRAPVFIDQLKVKNWYSELDPPEFSQYGGILPNNNSLSLTNPNATGNIYYTTDGTDPRLDGGGLNPNSTLYNGSFSLVEGVYDVKARVYNPSASLEIDKWSSACPRRFYVDVSYDFIAFNEIMYHPDSICSATDSTSLEFIELINHGSEIVNLAGSKISDGIYYEFPNPSILQPGQTLVLSNNSIEFQSKYGFTPLGQYRGRLENDGETVQLSDPFGNTLDSVKYNDNNPWDEDPDGNGPSLELLTPSSDNSDPINWFRSDYSCGTPGAANSRVCNNTAATIVINEINYNSDNGVNDPGDWVELHNPGNTAINISGWMFYDNNNEFVFPVGTILNPDAFLVLVENDALFTTVFPNVPSNSKLGDFSFGLSNKGERISLFDENKCLSDYVVYNDRLPWDTIPDGNGPTLSLIDPISDNTLPASWEASSNINAPLGTPGRANIPCPTFSITAPASICKGDSILLHTTPNSNVDFSWTIQGGTPATAIGDSVYVVFQNPGLALVELQYTYFECSDSDQQLLTIETCNQPPIPESDNYTINEDSTLQGNVLTNDNDPENQPLTVSVINDVGNGTLTLNANGSFNFVPNPNYYGSDNFIYEVCDNANPALCATQLVNIIINSVNDAPIATTDSFTGNEDSLITGNVLTNDSDIEGNSLTTSIMTMPVNGTLTIQINGDFTYTPNANYFGNDAFTYEVCDDGSPALCVTETVNLSIAPVNDPPVANRDNYTINEDNSLSDNVLTNDQEIENQPLTSQLLTNCLNGILSFNPDGSFNYVPNPNFFGLDSLTYEVCDDSTPAMCSQETVIINVLPINDQPIIVNDTLSTNEGIQVAGNASTNDFDVETNPMSYILISFTQNGSVLFNPNGSFYYTPFAGFSGIDSFQYRACDNGTPVYCDTATVYIEVIPDCVTLDIALALEGAYNPQTGYLNTSLNTVRAILPGMTGNPTAGQPYNSSPWNYQGTEGAGWADADYANTVVDWILISFRTDITKASEVHRRAGLLHTDGSVTFPGECLTTSDLSGDYYLVVEHRNHMAVMSPTKLSVVNRELTWDFRLANSYQSGGNGAKQLDSGIWALYAGDCNQIDDVVQSDINGKDKASWLLDNGKFGVYLTSDINMNGDVTGADKALWLLNNGVFGSVKK